MKPEYLEFLCCPKCNDESLEILTEEAGDRISEGTLRCVACESEYPIRNFIPRFSESTGYADSFGPQWRAFARSQLDDERSRESAIRFDSEIGWQHPDLTGKAVVEFGSGAGRFVDIVSKRGARLVIGLDATDAVDAAQESLGGRDNVFFVQGDIFNCPIRKQSCDFGYSIGVLHHTPDPEQCFRILTGVVRPGGRVGLSLYEISLYVRPNRNSVKVATMDLLWSLNLWRCEMFRAVTSRMPSKWFLAYCKTVVPVLHVINKIPVIRYLRYLLPSTCYRHLPVEWSMVDTHDTYATKIVHQYRGKDVFQWFLKEGIGNVILHNSRAGWVSVTGIVEEESVREERRLIMRQPAAPGLEA